MPHETRIATWREPRGAHLKIIRAVNFFILPLKAFAAICLGLGILGLLIGSVFSSNTPLVELARLTIPLIGISVLWVFNYRKVNSFTVPLPVHDHGDALPRMNAFIQFEVDGHLYGEDCGELTIVDEWLVFEGQRTTFSVAPHDIAQPERIAKLQSRYEVELRIKAAVPSVTVRIIAEDRQRDPSVFLDSWSSKTVPYPGISVLPPLEPMPGYRRGMFSQLLAPRKIPKLDTLLTLLWVYGCAVGGNMFWLHKISPAIGLPILAVASLVFWAPILGLRERSRRKALVRLAISKKKHFPAAR